MPSRSRLCPPPPRPPRHRALRPRRAPRLVRVPRSLPVRRLVRAPRALPVSRLLRVRRLVRVRRVVRAPRVPPGRLFLRVRRLVRVRRLARVPRLRALPLRRVRRLVRVRRTRATRRSTRLRAWPFRECRLQATPRRFHPLPGPSRRDGRPPAVPCRPAIQSHRGIPSPAVLSHRAVLSRVSHRAVLSRVAGLPYPAVLPRVAGLPHPAVLPRAAGLPQPFHLAGPFHQAGLPEAGTVRRRRTGSRAARCRRPGARPGPRNRRRSPVTGRPALHGVVAVPGPTDQAVAATRCRVRPAPCPVKPVTRGPCQVRAATPVPCRALRVPCRMAMPFPGRDRRVMAGRCRADRGRATAGGASRVTRKRRSVPGPLLHPAGPNPALPASRAAATVGSTRRRTPGRCRSAARPRGRSTAPDRVTGRALRTPPPAVTVGSMRMPVATTCLPRAAMVGRMGRLPVVMVGRVGRLPVVTVGRTRRPQVVTVGPMGRPQVVTVGPMGRSRVVTVGRMGRPQVATGDRAA
ncbi:hypothetical protein EDD30_6245 [Couchioplanes caeruleus]|nr:hypothetical protein EDD30_6245 [Couchioplanes caeruleus]